MAIFRSILRLLFVIYSINAQRGRQRRNKPKRKEEKGQHASALTVNYPLNFFASNQPKQWREPAKYDSAFVSLNEANKKWTEHSYAQDGEDVWLYENWFYGMKNGVILESGALDGILFSNSYMFEHYANWTTIHIEADPENYNNLKYNRINSININCALCSEPKLLHYSSEGAIPVRGFVEFMTQSFIKKWHKKLYSGQIKMENLPTIQCVTVKSLLSELHIYHIDIWILDVEGAEESVLKSTDFTTVHINAIAMECDEHDLSKNKRKTDIIESNGFICSLIERNCMCRNLKYNPSSAPEKTILRKWDGNKWADPYNSTIL